MINHRSDIGNAIKICTSLGLISDSKLRNFHIRADYHELLKVDNRRGQKKNIIEMLAEKYFLSDETVHCIIYKHPYRKIQDHILCPKTNNQLKCKQLNLFYK